MSVMQASPPAAAPPRVAPSRAQVHRRDADGKLQVIEPRWMTSSSPTTSSTSKKSLF